MVTDGEGLLATHTTSAPEPLADLTFYCPASQGQKQGPHAHTHTQDNQQDPLEGGCRETQEPLARQPLATQPQD